MTEGPPSAFSTDIDVCSALVNSAVDDSGLSDNDRELYRGTAEKRLDRMRKYAECGKEQDSEVLQQEILRYFGGFDPYRDSDGRPNLDVISKIKSIDDTMIQTLGINLPDGKWYRDRKTETLWEAKMKPILTHFKESGVIKDFGPAPEKGAVTLYRFISPGKQRIEECII